MWYQKGLKFKCTECGGCCTGAPGYTWVSAKEIEAMAEYLQMAPSEFGKKYLRKVKGKYSLLENPINFDCVFLKEKRCSIYPVRPTQCRTFPFWPQNLTSRKQWDEAAKYCEGINREEAPTIPLEKIEQQRQLQECSND